MLRIIESNFITSAVKSDSYPVTDLPEFAFVGRSNVGKSSMINTITSRKLLAKIANKPGKTRLINFFEIKYKNLEQSPLNTFVLVDLPGYGYAKVSQSEREKWKQMINTYFNNRKQLTGVVVLVDIRHTPDPKDILMIQMLENLNLNYIIACTKSDKIPKNKIHTQMKQYTSLFGSIYITEFSSLKKTGVTNILDWIGSNLPTET